MKLTTTLLAATALGLCFGSAASAEEVRLRLSTYAPPNESASVLLTWMTEQIAAATNNELTFEMFYASSLIPAKEHLRGVGDGVAHAGFQSAGYVPSELPEANALSPYGFKAANATAIGLAFADWQMHDPVALSRYWEANVVPLGGFSTPNYPIICNTKEAITKPEQIKGLKIRWPGGANADLTHHLGGVAVNIPGNELYQALQTGAIDCAGILAGFLNINMSLQEVATHVTLTNWTGSFQSPLVIYNRDTWQDLSEEHRKVLIEASARGTARMQATYNRQDGEAIEIAREFGVNIAEPSPELNAAVKAWVDNGLGDMAGIAKKTYGVEDPDALFASFDPYVEKWNTLVATLPDLNDEDAMAKLIIDNMYQDIGPDYGM